MKVATKKAKATVAVETVTTEAFLYILTEEQASHVRETGIRSGKVLEHVFETGDEYVSAWKTRWGKLMENDWTLTSDPEDAVVKLIRRGPTTDYFLTFTAEKRAKRGPEPTAGFVGPDGVLRTPEEVEDAFDISGYKLPKREEREEEDDEITIPENDRCTSCQGKGWTKCGRNGEQRSCIACNGHGTKQQRKDYHAKSTTPDLTNLHGNGYNTFKSAGQPKQRPERPEDPSYLEGYSTDHEPTTDVETFPADELDAETKAMVMEPRMPDGTYTVVSPRVGDGAGYRTIRIRTDNWGKDGAKDIKTVIELLVGPENTTDFMSVAFLNKDRGTFNVWKRFKTDGLPGEIARVMDILYSNPKAGSLEYGRRSGRCGICGRELTTPESLDAGIGPTCREKYGW